MKHSSLITLFLFLLKLQVGSFAQRAEVDSLRKELPSLKDTVRIDCMNELSFQYIRLLKRDSAQYFQGLAYKESEGLKYVHGIAEAISNQSGIFTYFDNDFIKGEALARQSLTWFEKTRNKANFENALNNLTFAYFAQSKYHEAYQISADQYEKYRLDNDVINMHHWLAFMSVIDYQEGNYDSAFYLGRKAQQLSIENNNITWISGDLIALGNLYRAIGDYQTALKNYRHVFLTDTRETIQYRIDKSWDTWRRMEFAELFSLLNQFDSAWHYYHLFDTTKVTDKDLRIYLVSTGETLLLQKEYRQALKNFQRGLVMHRRLNDINEIKRVLLDIAKTYYYLGNYPLALKYAEEGTALALKTKSSQFARDGYKVLYSVYDRLNKTDSAYYYYQKYIASKDAVVSDQTKGKFAAYKYEEEINSLNNAKLISQQKLKIQQQQLAQGALQRKIGVAAFIGLLFIGGFVFRTISLKRKHEKARRELAENELKIQKLETQQQLSELEMQALRAQMNPHFIFNSLNSINRFILQNNRLQASDYLTKFSRLVRLILQNSQASLITLECELESLQLYLELEAIRFDHHFDFKITVGKALETDILKVPPLIIQPFVENAIWHGLMQKDQKGHLEIDVFENDNMLCCKITDDGIGRKKAAELKSRSASAHKSMGMKITADRIANLRQNKQVETSIVIADLVLPDGTAGGTEVLLKLPMIV